LISLQIISAINIWVTKQRVCIWFYLNARPGFQCSSSWHKMPNSVSFRKLTNFEGFFCSENDESTANHSIIQHVTQVWNNYIP